MSDIVEELREGVKRDNGGVIVHTTFELELRAAKEIQSLRKRVEELDKTVEGLVSDIETYVTIATTETNRAEKFEEALKEIGNTKPPYYVNWPHHIARAALEE